MKQKYREITVGGMPFVYWHRDLLEGRPCTLTGHRLMLSPKDNRNNVLTLDFPLAGFEKRVTLHCLFWSIDAFYMVRARRAGDNVLLDLGNPELIGEMITRLLETGQWHLRAFDPAACSGWALLEQMGYRDFVPVVFDACSHGR